MFIRKLNKKTLESIFLHINTIQNGVFVEVNFLE